MEIKPCPFCGSENLSVKSWEGGGYIGYIICNNCEAYGPSATDEEKAIRLWNHAPRVGDNDCDYPNLTGGCHIFPKKSEEEPKMEKYCKNCVHISKEVDGKVYCTQDLDADYSCKYWEKANPFEPEPILCESCKYSYIYADDELLLYCGRAISNPEGYVCDKWETKEPKSTPLNPENSSGKPFINCAKEELIGIRIREPFFNAIQQLAEEAAELAQAALKYGRTKGMGSYTEVNPKDARDFMIEEFADVLLCMEAAFPHCSESTDFYSKLERTYCEKAKRWAEKVKRS